LRQAGSEAWLPAAALAALPVAAVVYLAVVFAVRLCLPRLRPGSYGLGMSAGMIAWYLHLALGRSLYVSGLQPLLHSFYLTKFLLWRALGARVPYRMNAAVTLSITDAPLVTIGRGTTMGDLVSIYAHSFIGDRLYIEPVAIGENVFLSKDVVVGLGARIGAGAWIGLSNKVFRVELAAGTRLDNFEWEHGPPKSPKEAGGAS
jgi:hypothetical protein